MIASYFALFVGWFIVFEHQTFFGFYLMYVVVVGIHLDKLNSNFYRFFMWLLCHCRIDSHCPFRTLPRIRMGSISCHFWRDWSSFSRICTTQLLVMWTIWMSLEWKYLLVLFDRRSNVVQLQVLYGSLRI